MSGPRIFLNLPETRVPPGLEAFLRENPEADICRCDEWKPEGGVDLLVFPADRLSSFMGDPEQRPKFFCTGHSGQIRHALVLGAADFLREPWDWMELLVRAERACSAPSSHSSGPIPEGFTFTELRLLWRLGESRGDPVSRPELEAALRFQGAESRSLDVHMWSLRKKLSGRLPDWPGNPLVSVRNKGYRLDFLAYAAISVVR